MTYYLDLIKSKQTRYFYFVKNESRKYDNLSEVISYFDCLL